MPPLDNTNGEQQQESQQEQAPAWATGLTEAVGGLSTLMKQAMTSAQQREKQQQLPPDDDADEEPSDEDLEVMPRGEFGKHIVAQVLKAVNKNVVEPINARLNEITVDTTRRDITGAISALKGKHKDFMDWKDEMIELANQNKGLAPHRLYQLARIDNPEKAKKLDDKYKPPREEGPRRPGFGGMTPSQSGTGSRTRKMAPKEASDVAWAETVAALGGEPIFDGDDT